ncbi:hypothetical protein RHSIM_Rhsim13G0002200 [Rhododendron simsii]|uniref:Pectinesterase n=1 Tax=Rhododendron simsii TaxID=118357 RepID=A0A834L7H3_RHOSS|nr:hypothetical protein RHSIM_Rhsim13G0002200 [Rhododendron simsii]
MRIGSKVFDLKLRNAEMNKVRINVSQVDGTGDFKSIKEALDSILLHSTKRVILTIKPGVYREKIVIPRTLPFITFLGDSNDPPTITWNDTKSVTGTTFSTATVGVNASYFVAINMKFENTATHDEGSVGEQVVALQISETNASFYNCSFYDSQDTLYDHHGVHYFSNCFIQGSVDFIFGYARSLYEIGWDDWDHPERELILFSHLICRTVYYGEYKCGGPGANFTRRVPWARLLTDKEAEPFIGTNYIYGDTWLINPVIRNNLDCNPCFGIYAIN